MEKGENFSVPNSLRINERPRHKRPAWGLDPILSCDQRDAGPNIVVRPAYGLDQILTRYGFMAFGARERSERLPHFSSRVAGPAHLPEIF